MIGKVIEGRFVGAGIYRLPEKNVLYIETAEGKKIGLSKKNALSIVEISERYSVKGCRMLCVTWNNYETSIVQLGFPASEAPTADPVSMEETVSDAEPVRSAASVNDGIRKGKALVCDMCGSNDLRIQNEMAVCQHCNTHYTLEDVQRIVGGKSYGGQKETPSNEMTRVEKLYILARRAKKDNNTENAAKYYDLIQQEDPSSWEAAFYSTFYAALNTNIAGIQSAALKISNSFRSILSLIQEAELDWKERYLAIYEMVHMTAGAAAVLASGARKHYNEIGSGPAGRYRDEAMARVYSAAMMLVELGDQIENVYTGDQMFCQLACLSWRTSIDFLLEDENKKLFYVIDDQEKLKKIILDISRKVECCDEEEKYKLQKKTLEEEKKKLEKQIAATPKTKAEWFRDSTKALLVCLVWSVLGYFVKNGLELAIPGWIMCASGLLGVVCSIIEFTPLYNKKREKYIEIVNNNMDRIEEINKELRKIEEKLNAKS